MTNEPAGAEPTTTEPGSDGPNRFDERYRITGQDVFVTMELAALGSDYQATGYATRDQADDLGRRLGLGPDRRLLDLGSGCGWPGLYLATTTGCEVVTADPVAIGAAACLVRGDRDGLGGRHLPVVARGEALPFRAESFDAVVHVDVTC